MTTMLIGLKQRKPKLDSTRRYLLTWIADHPAQVVPFSCEKTLAYLERWKLIEWHPISLGWVITDEGVHAL